MRFQNSLIALITALALCSTAQATIIAAPGAASAAGTLPLSAQTLASGTTGTGANSTLTLPASFNSGSSFQTTGTALSGDATLSFIDAYAFTLASAGGTITANSINFSTLLGISNLTARLYQAEVGDVIPLNGQPASFGNANSYYTATITSTPVPGGYTTVLTAALDPVVLNAGTYVLEVRGLVSGQFGGSYAGNLSLLPQDILPTSPVPLPAGLPLLGSALAGLAALRRRPRRAKGTAALLGVSLIGGLLVAGRAAATTIAPDSPILSAGHLSLSASAAASGTTGTGINLDLPTPGSYVYGRSFATTGSALPADATISFIDAYAFTVDASGGSAVTTSIAISGLQGISNLDTRLYQANIGDFLPLLSLPPSFGSSQGYYAASNSSTPLGGFGSLTTSAVDPVFLNAGTYVLEVRGLVSGTLGGSYSGALTLVANSVLPPPPTPVPLPATGFGAMMMVSGLLAWTRRLRPSAR
jgi:hypothetical protein